MVTHRRMVACVKGWRRSASHSTHPTDAMKCYVDKPSVCMWVLSLQRHSPAGPGGLAANWVRPARGLSMWILEIEGKTQRLMCSKHAER
jgi:hypothetical protein